MRVILSNEFDDEATMDFLEIFTDFFKKEEKFINSET